MAHLIIAKGNRQGEELEISDKGMRVGRAQSNDLVLDEASLSQFHCRFFFKSDGSLWVTDFGSTNETLVNGKAISEKKLDQGDLIDVGGSIFKVLQDQREAATPPSAPPPDKTEEEPQAGPPEEKPEPVSTPVWRDEEAEQGVDLGFRREPKASHKPLLVRIGWALATAMIIAALALVVVKFTGYEETTQTTQTKPKDVPLTIDYEKVEADDSNIFRYHLRLEDNTLSIKIDDIKNQRHVSREKDLDENIVDQLEKQVRDSEFFYLQPEYSGISPGIYELWDLSITLGKKTSRTCVFNRLEPEDFKEVRELIEDFGKTELGLAALALSPERLQDLARDAYLMGQKYHQERGVRYENLSAAIKQFKLAQWYLETLEPKPDFYEKAVVGMDEAKKALNERYEDYIFRAERAIKLGDWEEAAENLRIILKLIPDRSDERHKDARKQLLNVERHL